MSPNALPSLIYSKVHSGRCFIFTVVFVGKPPDRIDLDLAVSRGFSGGLDGKESACSAGNMGSIPRWGMSPGEGNGYLLWVFLPGEFHG